MTAETMLATLELWRDAGWLRHLDVALARFVAETDPQAPPSLLLATALVAHMEGRGHTGLLLPAIASTPQVALGWPDAGLTDLSSALAGWPEDPALLRERWAPCSAVEIDPADERGASPLVLAGPVLMLRRHWREEAVIGRHLGAMLQGQGRDESAPAWPALSRARALLDRLFPVPPRRADDAPEPPTSADQADPDWQKIVCALALRGRLTLVTGGPGTGKTYTAARVLVAMQALRAQAAPLRVGLAAPTGKAAARLRQSIAQALEPMRKDASDPLGLNDWAPHLGPGRTLHALLGPRPDSRRFRHDASDPLALDVLIVDEASMVHLGMMARLLDALPPSARLVLLGDKDQLASVEAGAVMGELCRHAVTDAPAGPGGTPAAPAGPDPVDAIDRPGYDAQTVAWVRQVSGEAIPASLYGTGSALAQHTVMLRHSRRFDGPIGQLAQRVNLGDPVGARALLEEAADGAIAMIEATDPRPVLHLAVHGRHDGAPGYLAHVRRLAQRPAQQTQIDGLDGRAEWDRWVRDLLEGFDRFRLLCVRRDGAWGVSGWNQAIEQALARHGLPVQAGEWYEGRPVMVTRNDAALGVFNGDIGLVLRGPGDDVTLRAHFLDGDTLRAIPVGRLPQVETAFAMTVHKSQGSEFGHVALVLPDVDLPVLTRECVYTGITRARSALTLVAHDPTLFDRALRRPTLRVSGLGRRLQSIEG